MYGTAKSTCELCLPQSPFAGMIRQSSFEQVNGGDPGFNETSPHLHRSVIRAGDEFENRMNHLAALWHGCAE
jgi:hypothetical protein